MTLTMTFLPDTHSRGGYGYSSPRRGHPAPFPPSRRPPPDPHTFDYPASLKQYAEWFRFYYPQQAIEEDNADKAAEQDAADGSKPRNGIKSKWEKYKKEFSATQVSLETTLFLFTPDGYCSYKRCLTIIGSLPGSPKNMIQHRSIIICAHE